MPGRPRPWGGLHQTGLIKAALDCRSFKVRFGWVCAWVYVVRQYFYVPIQPDPRFKNLGSGCKGLELCADVVSGVGIKAKSRLLRFL